MPAGFSAGFSAGVDKVSISVSLCVAPDFRDAGEIVVDLPPGRHAGLAFEKARHYRAGVRIRTIAAGAVLGLADKSKQRSSDPAELQRRIDPRHRSLGQFFQDEIATPLGLDAYIRLPESIPNSYPRVVVCHGTMRTVLGPSLSMLIGIQKPSHCHPAPSAHGSSEPR